MGMASYFVKKKKVYMWPGQEKIKNGATRGMFKVKPNLRAIALCVHANAGTKMPPAQAHPFQPMLVLRVWHCDK